MPYAITVSHYAPLLGSPGEALWLEGEASYVMDGRASRDVVTRPHPGIIAWCAEADGALAGIQACRLVPGETYAHGLLSYVRPQYRRCGIFRALQVATDAGLLALGCDRIRSLVVPGYSAPAMAAAIETRGGQVRSVVPVEALRGLEEYTEYERLLVGAE